MGTCLRCSSMGSCVVAGVPGAGAREGSSSMDQRTNSAAFCASALGGRNVQILQVPDEGTAAKRCATNRPNSSSGARAAPALSSGNPRRLCVRISRRAEPASEERRMDGSGNQTIPHGPAFRKVLAGAVGGPCSRSPSCTNRQSCH